MKHIQIVGLNLSIGISHFMVGCVFEVEHETDSFYIIKKHNLYPDVIAKCNECVLLPKNISECKSYIDLLLLRTRLTYDIFYAETNEDISDKINALESFVNNLNGQSDEQGG